MIRTLMLLSGFVLLLLQQFLPAMDTGIQFTIFLTGIVLLGIPHGAADLLVASQNDSGKNNTAFSTPAFLFSYISRLMLFAVVLYFFPVAGNLLFIGFAAYHFGETDLYHFNTSSIQGKLLVVAYGLVILSVILLHHFEEVIPLFLQYESGRQNINTINWISEHRYLLMSGAGVLFFFSVFTYFLNKDNNSQYDTGRFLIHFALIIFILFNLPMLLGFTFYFVVWHSALSLTNIVKYLRGRNGYPAGVIIKQILLYSVLALAGIAVFGAGGIMFNGTSAITSYLFLGLAVLTAPHMQIMHNMYRRIRLSNHQ